MTSFSKKTTSNWQDVVNLIVGLLLIISPWVLSFAGIQVALWNAVIFGIVIALLALSTLLRFKDWEEWVDMVVGVWLIISPWVLGFAATTATATAVGGAAVATWTFVVFGVVTIILAAWALSHHHGGGARTA